MDKMGYRFNSLEACEEQRRQRTSTDDCSICHQSERNERFLGQESLIEYKGDQTDASNDKERNDESRVPFFGLVRGEGEG